MAGALLVVGAIVGNGVASTLVDMSDGTTWLPEDDQGTVVQINPATGEPERRLQIAAGEAELELAQRDGRLIVTDRLTGEITAVDLSTLLASGQRTAADPADTRVLVGGGHVALVELGEGLVRAVSPLTLADIGTPYRTDALADATIDDAGRVWVIGQDGRLQELEYRTEAREHAVRTDVPVEAAGPASRLVPHARGVTVFAPDRGAVVQIGSGSDVSAGVPQLEGALEVAPRSPSDLVPASIPERGRVVVLSGRDVLSVDVAAIGCERPAQPQTFSGRIYVPCTGAGKVVVLNSDGSRGAADIIVPGGGDPRLTIDEGRLVVHTKDRSGGYVLVDGGGTTRVVEPEPTAVTPVPVDRPLPPRPAPPQPQVPGAGGPTAPQPPVPTTDAPAAPTDTPTGAQPPEVPGVPTPPVPTTPPPGLPSVPVPTDLPTDVPTDGGTVVPPTTGGPTDTGTGTGPVQEYAPTNIRVTAANDPATARVTWQASEVPAVRYQVTASVGTGAEVAATAPLESTLTELVCGREIEVRVTAVHVPAVTQPVTRETTYTPECAPGSTPPTEDPTSPSPTETTPSPTETTPSPTETTPSPTETTPSPTETTPSPTGTTPAPTPTADRPTAATGVSATARPDGTVIVTWNAATRADRYSVRPAGGGQLTDAGTATSATVPAAAGSTVAYEVVSHVGTETAVSAASGSVTVPARPGAPGVGVTVTRNSPQQVALSFAITPPADGGSPIIDYTLNFSGPSVTPTQVPLGGQTTHAVTIDCNAQGLCRDGGTVSATVTATNAAGEGAAGSGSGSLAALPVPSDNDGVLTGRNSTGTNTVTAAVDYAPIASWVETPGTCTTGGQVIDCATPTTIAEQRGARNVGAWASGEVTFTGSGWAAGITATVSGYADAPGEAYCEPGGPCYQIASLPPTEVQVVPVPWTAPQIPHPPAVAAGVLLLGTAGAMRLKRRRTSLAEATDTSDAAATTAPTTSTTRTPSPEDR
ncbi:hypothetical protein [Litorihabitans aurantiacus]|uniref:Fibronectin type-III domain-containing protein n=1 Tax=Litorihabitans aurantiacus TaxID=1930061 RepID=A0AA37UHL5_9MICO|nr:hypothetical protein [Litorihabitans aurantiacus]GMA30759.1 hypothetical protein GCM10025875_07510 [Litorihabitans aurantiacus]